MNSEHLVRLVIFCLTVIVLLLIATIAMLAKWHVGNEVIVALVTLAGSAVGGLGSLLANSGSSVSAKSGGTVEMAEVKDDAPDVQT